MEDFDKTIPPRRMPDEGSAMDVTMPGRRDRRTDGRFVAGDLIMNRYKVLAELGQGGMGVVYRCLDETAGIEVALKALPPELSHNTIEMEDIKDNFQLVAKLIHQNIAISKNLEKDQTNGNYYLIMECCEGEDLRRWIKQKRKEESLTQTDIFSVIRQVAEALDYAHEQKVIHRDIKPGNIMIDPAGKIKVLDFGLAARIHTSMTRISMAYHGTSGTGPYMAPEQWRGRAQGAPADQYALAVMTYEMLAGHLPFESSDPAVLQQAVLTQEPELVPGVSNTVQNALKRAMRKDPAERFESCSDFADALEGKNKRSAVRTGNGSRKWAAVLLFIIFLCAAGTGLFLFSHQTESAGPEPEAIPEQPEKTAVPQVPVELKPEKTEAEMDAELAVLKSNVESAAKEIYQANYAPGQTFGEKIKTLQQNIQYANNSRRSDTAVNFLKKAKEAADWLKRNAPRREEALKMVDRISSAEKKVEIYEPEKFSPETLKKAKKVFAEGKRCFDSGEFTASLTFLKGALAYYRKVEMEAKRAKTENLLQAARAQKGKNWQKVSEYASAVLKVNSGNSEAKSLKKAADLFLQNEECITLFYKGKYRQAFDMLPGIETAESEFFRGLFCLFGFNVCKIDYQAAYNHFQKSASMGSLPAKVWVSYCMFSGIGCSSQPEEAKKNLEKNTDALQRLFDSGDHWAQAVPLSSNDKITGDFERVRKAAEQGNPSALFMLGYCYYNGHGVTKDLKEAVKWFEKAAETGMAYAQAVLGNLYYSGDVGKKDTIKAIEWFRKAAEQGLPSAMRFIGICYYNGHGVTKDLKEAVKWFEKAAAQNDTAAQEILGKCYCEGNGVNEDLDKAVALFRKSAEQGGIQAQMGLGLCYMEKKEYDEAVKWFDKVAKTGNVEALFSSGVCYFLKNDYNKARKVILEAVEKKYPPAQYWLYMNRYKFRLDQTKAFKWLQEAAELGHPKAQCELGDCYQYGRNVSKNSEEAAKWYRKAAEKGDPEGQVKWGNSLIYGKGVKKNQEEAVLWYRKAADQNFGMAFYSLGMSFEYGRGVKSDLKKALEFYQKAADLGIPQAHYKLGSLYENGKGTKKDLNAAVQWYQKAAGHFITKDSAERALKRLKR